MIALVAITLGAGIIIPKVLSSIFGIVLGSLTGVGLITFIIKNIVDIVKKTKNKTNTVKKTKNITNIVKKTKI